MRVQAARIVARQHLEDGVVFAVDGQDGGAVLVGGFHKQAARHHQRFFVRQIDGFAVRGGGQRRGQPCRAHNRAHHAADFACGGYVNQGLFAVQDFGVDFGFQAA